MRRPSSLLAIVALAATALASAGAGEPRPLRGLRAEVAALLMQGVAGGPLPVAVALFPASPAASGSGLGYLLEVPGRPAGTDTAGRELEVYAYAVAAGGEVVAHQALAVPAGPEATEGLKVSGLLTLPPGDLSLRFLVFDPATRAYGMAVRSVGPGPRAALRVAEPCGGWATAVAGGEDLTAASARPVLLTGERFEVARPGAAPPEGGWRLHLRAASGDPQPHSLAPAARVGEELVFELPVLEQGVYDLALGGGTADQGALTLQAWVVSSLPGSAGGCARSWTNILRLVAGGPGPAPAAGAGAVEPARRRAGAGFARSYRRVLLELAETADLPAAASRLADLEAGVAAHAVNVLPAVHGAELTTSRRLAELDPHCLVPVVSLHARTYALHYSRGRYPLSTHSRRLAAAVAEMAAERLTVPEERSLIGAALTDLARAVEGHRMSLPAQALLERALELDGELEAARLLLAVSYERGGRLDDARRQLEILVAANAAHLEARLRLSVLQWRSGELAAAERQALELVGERPPDWLLSLAYQTLARVLAAQDRHSEAVAHLRRATARLPRDQSLHLLLAYALDRSGERGAAQSVLAALPLAAEAAATPRYRYSDTPARELGLLQETLGQSLTVRLPILAQALRRHAAGGSAP